MKARVELYGKTLSPTIFMDENRYVDLPTEYKKPVPCSFIQQFNERRKQDGDVVEVEKTIFQGKD